MPPPFDRLLVPVDFSAASRAAYEVAIDIAERWASQIVLFNAAGFDANDEFLDHTGADWGRSDVVGEAREHLRRFADTVVKGSADRVEIDAVRDDDPVHAVRGACARHAPSLLVLGADGRERRRRWRRSQTERIARAVTCPVLLVRGQPEAPMDADS